MNLSSSSSEEEDSDDSSSSGTSNFSSSDESDDKFTKDQVYKIGKKVAVFPGEESFRKHHVNGVVKYKTKMPGIAADVYGIHLKDGSSSGLGIKLTKKQMNCLSEKQLKWWQKDKREKLWVEGYMLCESRLVSDI